MLTNRLSILICALLCALATFHSISAADDTNVFFYGKRNTSHTAKNINVVVESMVYCQSCELAGSQKLSYDNPINGAVVSVLCDNAENINYYKTFETTEDGHLYAELKGFVISKDELNVPIKSCSVRLVSSPNVYCDFPTNVNYGGGFDYSLLRSENRSISNERYIAEIYAAGPLAFRPAKCGGYGRNL